MIDNEFYILILIVKGYIRFGLDIFYCISILYFSLYM